jgi:threonyl-tRNA synthetase
MRVDDEAAWDLAEATLENALKGTGLPYEVLPGEGAFYGPKLEFHLTDAIGRTWQCGTLQLDAFMPGRLGASYIGEDGEKRPPLMLHRAILGTFERFLGIMIENHAGRFPLWLAPVQAVVATIVSEADGYAGEVLAALKAAGIRAEADLRNEKINYKVREHSLAKVPNLLVVGKREAEEGAVALRPLGAEARQEVLPLTEAVTRLVAEAVPPDLR